MQQSSGTLQENFSVLMCCFTERSPSDPDTCAGRPQGAGLAPREIDLLPLSLLFTVFYWKLLWKRVTEKKRKKKRRRRKSSVDK